MVYDLNECDIKVTCAHDIEKSNIFKHTTNSSSNLHDIKNTVKKSLKIKKQRCSSVDRKDFSSNKLESHLNYFIEIDHPYLQKCVLKSDNIFDAIDFSKQIKSIVG